MPTPMTLKRIDNETVVASFRKIGMRPIRRDYVTKDRKGCCAMTAVAINLLKPRGFQMDRFNVGTVAKNNLGVSDLYFAGFITGWDGDDLSHEAKASEFCKGVSDGRTAWQACYDDGLIGE